MTRSISIIVLFAMLSTPFIIAQEQQNYCDKCQKIAPADEIDTAFKTTTKG
jgi:hypothetical protein